MESQATIVVIPQEPSVNLVSDLCQIPHPFQVFLVFKMVAMGAAVKYPNPCPGQTRGINFPWVARSPPPPPRPGEVEGCIYNGALRECIKHSKVHICTRETSYLSN